MLLAQLRARGRGQDGQALVEYALIISLVAIFVVGALTFMREPVGAIFSQMGSAF
jgi:Flp pilus assembly pilin Flp